MKKILLALFVSVLSFGSGLAGMYFMVPTLAPDLAEAASADSLSHIEATPDTLTAEATDEVKEEHPEKALPDLMALLGDSLAESPATQQDIFSMMQDSLQILKDSLRAIDMAYTTLQEEADGLVERVQSFESTQVQTEELSKTLTKMEDKELSAIVQQLNPEVLASLYEQASGRNRTRLLQALSPGQAAQFVHRLSGAPAAAEQATALPDTTARADAALPTEDPSLNE